MDKFCCTHPELRTGSSRPRAVRKSYNVAVLAVRLGSWHFSYIRVRKGSQADLTPWFINI